MPATIATAGGGLRAWARGDFPQEAGVELLIRSFGGRFAEVGCPWIKACDRPGWFWLDITTLLDYAGVCSGGERRILSVVAALVDGRPVVDLIDVLTGIDREHTALLLAAFSHAAGSHKHVELVRHGDELRIDPLPALVPWPGLDMGRAA